MWVIFTSLVLLILMSWKVFQELTCADIFFWWFFPCKYEVALMSWDGEISLVGSLTRAKHLNVWMCSTALGRRDASPSPMRCWLLVRAQHKVGRLWRIVPLQYEYGWGLFVLSQVPVAHPVCECFSMMYWTNQLPVVCIPDRVLQSKRRTHPSSTASQASSRAGMFSLHF